MGIWDDRIEVDAMLAALAALVSHLLALGLAFLHAFFRIDWQRFLGSPSMAAGALAVLPAAWLVIRENLLLARLQA
ncbi:hypothetical protein [Massilia sp. SYSU DXS3249]